MAIVAKINMDFFLARIFHLRASLERSGEKLLIFVISCHKDVDVRIILVFDLWSFWRNFLRAKHVPEVYAELECFDQLYDNNNQTEYNIDCIKIKWHCEGETVTDVNDSRSQRNKID